MAEPGRARAVAGGSRGPGRAPSRVHAAPGAPRPACWAPEALLAPSPLGGGRPPLSASPPPPRRGCSRNGLGPAEPPGAGEEGPPARPATVTSASPGRAASWRARLVGAGRGARAQGGQALGEPRARSALGRKGHAPGARLRPHRDLGLASTPVFSRASPPPALPSSKSPASSVQRSLGPVATAPRCSALRTSPSPGSPRPWWARVSPGPQL